VTTAQLGLFSPLPDVCSYHGRNAVCDRCPAEYSTDGYGFPHFPLTSGLQRLRVCPECNQPKVLADWSWKGHHTKAPCCTACLSKAERVAPEPERRRA
jgi:hypothetical protein